MIGRLVCALVVAIVVGLALVYLLGPILISMTLPIALIVGDFLVKWGFILGLAAGLWYFFSGQTWPLRRA
jgi:hypothetical protein